MRPAYTHFGQHYQRDAIYVRDLAADHLAPVAVDCPPDKLIELTCLYELAGVPDCAAEVLNRWERRLAEFGDREPLLDALTPTLFGEQPSYRDYTARFKRNPELFLPSAAPSTPPSPPDSAVPLPTASPPGLARRMDRWIRRQRATIADRLPLD